MMTPEQRKAARNLCETHSPRNDLLVSYLDIALDALDKADKRIAELEVGLKTAGVFPAVEEPPFRISED